MKSNGTIKNLALTLLFSIGVLFLYCANSDALVTYNSTYYNSLHLNHFKSMGAKSGQLLRYNGSSWEPLTINGPFYSGNWDAARNDPDLCDSDYQQIGSYYIVEEGGSGDGSSYGGCDLRASNTDETSWDAGDWIMWNDPDERWEKIDLANKVKSFNGRAGEVYCTSNDYSWDDFSETFTSIHQLYNVYVPTTPSAEYALVWNKINFRWEATDISPKDDSIDGFVLDSNSVTTSEIENGSITNLEIGESAAISYSKLLINDNEIPLNRFTGLTEIMNTRLTTAGGTLSGDINMNNYNFTNVASINDIVPSSLHATIASNSAYTEHFKANGIVETVSAVSPIYSNGVATPNLTITQANETTDGFILYSHWERFNIKQDQITNADNITMGSLTLYDQAGVNIGPYFDVSTKAGELHLQDTSGINYFALKSPTTLAGEFTLTLPESLGTNGQVLSTDSNGNLYWKDAAVVSGVIANVWADLPLISTGGTTPTISIPKASSIQSGYLHQDDWNIFNSKHDNIDSSSDLNVKSIQVGTQGGLFISPYGTASGETGEINFYEPVGTNYVGFKAPDDITGATVWQLPATDGAPNYILTTNGSSQLTWSNALDDNSVTSSMLATMGATSGDYLEWHGTSWGPSVISNFKYLGSWDASSGPPVTPTDGGYYIVSSEGTTDLGGVPGTDNWEINDWALYNLEQNHWEKINNSPDDILNISATAPISATGVLTTTISINLADATNDGYLSADDWDTFNSKQNEIGINDNIVLKSLTSTEHGGIIINPYFNASSQAGELHFFDTNNTHYISFQAPTTLPDDVILTLPISAGNAFQAVVTDTNGNLHWKDIAKPEDVVRSVSGDSPIYSSGGSTPVISMTAATDSISGYVDTVTWNTFDQKQAKLSFNYDLRAKSITTDSQNALTFLPDNSGAGPTGELRFLGTNNINYVGFTAPDVLTSDTLYSLPSTDGLPNQTLTTGPGNLLVWDTLLVNDAITSSMLSNMGATQNQLLQWHGTTWNPTSIYKFKYTGDWSASSGTAPTLPGISGGYYVVTTAGNEDLGGGPGTDSWNVNDWAVYNSNLSRWEKIGDSIIGLTALTATSPMFSTEGFNPTISISTASSTDSGQILFSDWNIFNNKQDLVDNNTDLSVASIQTNSENGLTVAPYYSDGSSSAGEFRFLEDIGPYYLALRSPTTASTYTLTLPDSDGSANQVLSTDISGNLSWITVTATSEVVNDIVVDSPLEITSVINRTISINQASATQSGYISSTDWNVFNEKQDLLDSNDVLSVRSLQANRGVTVAGEIKFLEPSETNYVALKAPTLSSDISWILPSTLGTSNQVISTDGTNKLYWNDIVTPGGIVTNISGDGIISLSGSTTRTVSISQASSTDSGFLSSSDWNLFDNKQDAITPGLPTDYIRGDFLHEIFASSVQNATLTGFTSAAGTVNASDSILESIQKINGNLALKEDSISSGTTLQYYSGNEPVPWQTLNTNAVTEGANLYYTISRAQTDIVEVANITDGLTTKAPSSDAVYDALSLKQDYSPNLNTISSLATAAGNIIVSNGSEWTVESAGTGANNIFRLDSSGRLPAVDGSLLTNVRRTVENIDSDYSVAVTDSNKVFLVEDTTTLTLPSPASAGIGFSITVKNIDATATATIDASAEGATLDGSSGATLEFQYAYRTVVSDGTNWLVVAQNETIIP